SSCPWACARRLSSSRTRLRAAPCSIGRQRRSACVASNDRPVALITGAARRVGARIARRLHAGGWNLALHYRGAADEMEQLVAELDTARPGSAAAWQAELADFDRLPELVAQAVGRFGRLDALVNNASAFY